MTENQKLSLHQKLFDITRRVNRLAKDTSIEFGSTKYNAITEGHVLKIFRPLYAEHRLMLYPYECRSIQAGKVTVSDYRFRIVDIDTGEDTFVSVAGGGHDGADKGPGKAATYSIKYAFLKLHNVITGDDPDLISSAEILQTEKDEKAIANIKDEDESPVTGDPIGAGPNVIPPALQPTLTVIDKYMAMPEADKERIKTFKEGVVRRYLRKEYNTSECYALANNLGDNEAYKDSNRLDKAIAVIQ